MKQPKIINPENTTLQLLDGHWQKICAMLVWKFAKDGTAVTAAEIEQMNRENPQGLTLLAHGHYDNIEFKLVSQADAMRMAAWDAQQKGRA